MCFYFFPALLEIVSFFDEVDLVLPLDGGFKDFVVDTNFCFGGFQSFQFLFIFLHQFVFFRQGFNKFCNLNILGGFRNQFEEPDAKIAQYIHIIDIGIIRRFIGIEIGMIMLRL